VFYQTGFHYGDKKAASNDIVMLKMTTIDTQRIRFVICTQDNANDHTVACMKNKVYLNKTITLDRLRDYSKFYCDSVNGAKYMSYLLELLPAAKASQIVRSFERGARSKYKKSIRALNSRTKKRMQHLDASNTAKLFKEVQRTSVRANAKVSKAWHRYLVKTKAVSVSMTDFAAQTVIGLYFFDQIDAVFSDMAEAECYAAKAIKNNDFSKIIYGGSLRTKNALEQVYMMLTEMEKALRDFENELGRIAP
jgi:hypothetical protein